MSRGGRIGAGIGVVLAALGVLWVLAIRLPGMVGPPPVLTPTPTAGPAPTIAPGGSGEVLFLTQIDFGQTRAGAPPLTVALTGNAPPGAAAGCQAVHWEWGDGTSDTAPCQPDSGVSGYRASHTYITPGIYYPRVRMETRAGERVSAAQTVLVGATPRADLGGDILRGGLWGISILAAGGAAWRLRRARSGRGAGYLAVALALITFLPPFSYLPNPAGILWGIVGYSYDPRLPFVNRFLVAEDPTPALRATLDALRGQTGLDPLDPVQPLAGYEFSGVSLGTLPYGRVTVTTRLTYTDGSQRTYAIPAGRPYQDVSGYYQGDWRYDGLGRLRTEHRAFPGLPFADATTPLHLASPERLALAPAAEALGSGAPAPWSLAGLPVNQSWLLPAPSGVSFLVAVVPGEQADQRSLWLVQPGAAPLVPVAPAVEDFAWSPDGRYIVYSTPARGAQPRTIVITGPAGQARHLLAPAAARVPDLPAGPHPGLPGLTAEGAWYTDGDRIWIAPYDNGTAHVGGLRAADGGPLRPAPDGRRLAYVCGDALCLQDREDGAAQRVAVPAVEIAWSRDSQMLAAVSWDPQYEAGQPATLTLVRRDGTILRTLPVAPDGPTGVPQWTPDGRFVFLQTYPHGGRRIILVDAGAPADSGSAWDLTPPRWDPLFALAPAGTHLLLTTGRGGFWQSALR